jgi:hypothetical protein
MENDSITDRQKIPTPFEDKLRGANMLYSLEPTGHADATPLQIATTKILGIESRNWRTRQKL